MSLLNSTSVNFLHHMFLVQLVGFSTPDIGVGGGGGGASQPATRPPREPAPPGQKCPKFGGGHRTTCFMKSGPSPGRPPFLYRREYLQCGMLKGALWYR
jgi:hypothetical protein